MYPGEFGSDLNWKLSLIQARLLLSRQEHHGIIGVCVPVGGCARVSSFSAFSSSSRARSDLVFGCHALYLARGIEGVGVTSVAGFRWTL